jgi:hypothetical protein
LIDFFTLYSFPIQQWLAPTQQQFPHESLAVDRKRGGLDFGSAFRPVAVVFLQLQKLNKINHFLLLIFW